MPSSLGDTEVVARLTLRSGPSRRTQRAGGRTIPTRHTRGIVTHWLPRTAGRVRASFDNAVRTVRDRPAHAARASAEFLLRWALRIALPIGGAIVMLTVFPYHATAGGARFNVQGSLLTRSSLSADTSFGSWTFPHVD